MGGYSLNPVVQFGVAAAGAAFEAYRGGSTTMVRQAGRRRRRSNVDYSGYRQLRKKKRADAVGRVLPNAAKITKVVEANNVTLIDRFQYMNPICAVKGYYSCSAAMDTGNNIIQLPLYLFDLTSLRKNRQSSSLTDQWSYPFMRLVRNLPSNPTDPNLYQWYYQVGATNTTTDGAASSSVKWQFERGPYDTNFSYYREKVFLDWADIRLQMWGARVLPSGIEVSIVRFTDPELQPSAGYENTGGTSSNYSPVPTSASDARLKSKYTKFWTALTDNQVGSSQLVRHQAADTDGMVRLYTKYFDFNPVATYEADTAITPGATPNPAVHQAEHKIFYNMGMLGDYRPEQGGAGSYEDGLNANVLDDVNKIGNAWPTVATIDQTIPVLRNRESRVFLMIRGFQYCPATSAGGYTDSEKYVPSFDLQVRRKTTINLN